jgi:hypothetical protein
MQHFFFFEEAKMNILPQQKGLPSTRCAKEETPKYQTICYHYLQGTRPNTKEQNKRQLANA